MMPTLWKTQYKQQAATSGTRNSTEHEFELKNYVVNKQTWNTVQSTHWGNVANTCPIKMCALPCARAPLTDLCGTRRYSALPSPPPPTSSGHAAVTIDCVPDLIIKRLYLRLGQA
ncbi:hypothetical protein ACJJTC_015650 [Scirpophaga incertulas]